MLKARFTTILFFIDKKSGSLGTPRSMATSAEVASNFHVIRFKKE